KIDFWDKMLAPSWKKNPTMIEVTLTRFSPKLKNKDVMKSKFLNSKLEFLNPDIIMIGVASSSYIDPW
ncbi:hypothetical protein Bpfe_006433, partial [Biomphalaria pfeifferi]